MSAGAALAVIPARGGSRRVPRKNIRDMHGRPLLAYSIDAALGSGSSPGLWCRRTMPRLPPWLRPWAPRFRFFGPPPWPTT